MGYKSDFEISQIYQYINCVLSFYYKSSIVSSLTAGLTAGLLDLQETRGAVKVGCVWSRTLYEWRLKECSSMLKWRVRHIKEDIKTSPEKCRWPLGLWVYSPQMELGFNELQL